MNVFDSDTPLSVPTNLEALFAEPKETRSVIATRNGRSAKRIDGLEQCVNSMLAGRQRQGREFDPYASNELEEARGAHHAFKSLVRNGGDYRTLERLSAVVTAIARTGSPSASWRRAVLSRGDRWTGEAGFWARMAGSV